MGARESALEAPVDLDETLVASAEAAGKPLAKFIYESIVDPQAYVRVEVARGFLEMPSGLNVLSEEQVRDIVAFLVEATSG